MWDHKGYHLDHPSLGHPNISKIEPDVSSVPRDLHVSPVTTHLTLSTLHPSGIYGPKDVQFGQRLRDHDRSTSGVYHRNDNYVENLIWLIEIPFRIDNKEIHSKKVATIEVIESIDVTICFKHSSLATWDTSTGLRDEMVVGNVEVHMDLKVVMNTILTLLMVDIVVIMVASVMVVVFCQIIYMVKVQTAIYFLRWIKGIDTIDKIGMQKPIQAEYDNHE